MAAYPGKSPPPPTAAYVGKPLATIVHKAPDFAAVTWTTAKMMGNAAGGNTGVSEGNELVKEFAIADPAADVAASLASDTVRGATALAAERGVALAHEATGPVFARADRDRLVQLLLILVDNAVDHSPKGTTVTVRIPLPAAPLNGGGR